MTDPENVHCLELSHVKMIGLYLALSRQEAVLDDNQRELLEQVAGQVFSRLSVSQAEDPEAYYRELHSSSDL